MLTGIGHAQMLISGNLTTLRKLCKVYLEANSQVKKRQSIDYIPLRSDLEGYWDLILIQYRRFESQFPHLCDWISKDFRNDLQNFVEKSVGYQFVQISEVESSKQLDNETTRSPRKELNIAASKSRNHNIVKLTPTLMIRLKVNQPMLRLVEILYFILLNNSNSNNNNTATNDNSRSSMINGVTTSVNVWQSEIYLNNINNTSSSNNNSNDNNNNFY
ncbi:unnamed protein product [Trichobilharzia regenti]|nr:unnamed protein product [Trichobilharzia regenti]